MAVAGECSFNEPKTTPPGGTRHIQLGNLRFAYIIKSIATTKTKKICHTRTMQVHHSILLASCWAIGLLVDEASCSFVPFNDEIDDKKDKVQLHPNEVASAAGAAFAVVTVVTDTTTDDNKTKKQTSYCPLNCQNGSLCTKKTIPEDNNNNNNSVSDDDDDDDEWECVCPERFTGQFCEVPRRELSTTNCGDLICEYDKTATHLSYLSFVCAYMCCFDFLFVFYTFPFPLFFWSLIVVGNDISSPQTQHNTDQKRWPVRRRAELRSVWSCV